MSSFGRRVLIQWVFMVVLLSLAENGISVDLHVEVTNALDGDFDLTVYCKNIDPTQHILHYSDSYQWDFSGNFSSTKPPFLCYFKWGELQVHTYNLVVPIWDFECKKHCQWFIREDGPCNKYYSTKLVCFPWN
ncbi:hypothetical protein VNO80_07691 [Phaseolus coccineus]|uniref:S-protein homolog n=1 Tax=Phaseolus coccineus TaxID=3886 RepID=A0AAN9NP56_PHACN